jgi:dolichol-phosphate mannosyltransferase
MDKSILLSVVVSVYNEEEALVLFFNELTNELKKINDTYEVIFVNDGSTDKSKDILNELAKNNDFVKVINFSRNFGHEAAMLAGIDYSNGQAIICMDADLQHPPSYITQMISKYKNGYDIVLMKRSNREDASFFPKIASKLFYKIINYLSPVKFEDNASDFFLISKKVQYHLVNNFRERTRFLRGLIQFIGFNKTFIEFIAPARISGKSKYNTKKLLKLSINAIAAFSDKPLNLGIIIGLIMGLFSTIVGIYSIIMYFVNRPVSGYTTIVVVLTFMFSINLIVMGIIGKYISYIFYEVKERPIYIIEEIIEKNKT